jgi:NAD(P)-dependent dehydrogenase (short-subunit alcohol dehydrogenase family)
MMQIDLSGRVAVVTGGSSGIGLAAARLLAAAGARVAFCARDADRLQAAERAVLEQVPGAAILCRPCNVLDADDVARFAEAVQARFGRTDILVNNAGQGRVSTFADTSDEAWREELDLKYFSIVRPTRTFLPMLRRSDAASIVCVNSLLALQPEAHMVATSSARAGVLSLTKSLAGELAADGVRVNSILVGLVESGQWRRRYQAQAQAGESWQAWTAALARKKGIPLGRLGTPDEAAQAIFFLATSMSSYTTGSHVDLSGGLARHV